MNFEPEVPEVNAVLLVDDNLTTARWVGCLASHLGFNPVLASDAAEAQFRLIEQEFAVVISDVEMPGMSGLEFLQCIRRDYPEAPVILMTAFYDHEQHEAARASGAMALIEKPVNTDQLAALLGTGAESTRKLSVKGMHLFSAPLIAATHVSEASSQSHPTLSIYKPGEQPAAA
jgi:CheY-like chemotaxis protein